MSPQKLMDLLHYKTWLQRKPEVASGHSYLVMLCLGHFLSREGPLTGLSGMLLRKLQLEESCLCRLSSDSSRGALLSFLYPKLTLRDESWELVSKSRGRSWWRSYMVLLISSFQSFSLAGPFYDSCSSKEDSEEADSVQVSIPAGVTLLAHSVLYHLELGSTVFVLSIFCGTDSRKTK